MCDTRVLVWYKVLSLFTRVYISLEFCETRVPPCLPVVCIGEKPILPVWGKKRISYSNSVYRALMRKACVPNCSTEFLSVKNLKIVVCIDMQTTYIYFENRLFQVPYVYCIHVVPGSPYMFIGCSNVPVHKWLLYLDVPGSLIKCLSVVPGSQQKWKILPFKFNFVFCFNTSLLSLLNNLRKFYILKFYKTISFLKFLFQGNGNINII